IGERRVVAPVARLAATPCPGTIGRVHSPRFYGPKPDHQTARIWQRQSPVAQLKGADKNWLFTIDIREQGLQRSNLWQVVKHDIRPCRIERQEILVVLLGRVKRLQRLDGRDDWTFEQTG